MTVGEEVTAEAEVGEDTAEVTITRMITAVVTTAGGRIPRGERTRKTSSPIIWNTSPQRTIQTQPGHCSSVTWSHPPRRENKKDKFPNYLEHISPEDDPNATRTLFIGNLELNITLEEMKRIFGKHGDLVDIDIKRPPPNTGNAFAFLRYRNLDMAAEAKRELSGQYIGKFQCKIGYGKVHKTSRVWLGGLGDWCSRDMIEREFDRFGAMGNIDYETGDSEAIIQYETIDAAAVAVNEMRGYNLGGPGKRIKIDFADDPNYEPP